MTANNEQYFIISKNNNKMNELYINLNHKDQKVVARNAENLFSSFLELEGQ